MNSRNIGPVVQKEALCCLERQALIKHRVDPRRIVDRTNPAGAVHILDHLTRGNRISCLVFKDGREVHVLGCSLVKGRRLPVLSVQASLRRKKLPGL
jgi:hypothetical protein